MSEFNGRTMRYTDSFGQKFNDAGHFRYRLGVNPTLRLPDDEDEEYEIVVTKAEGKAKPGQHHVTVEWRDGHFHPDHEHLEIRVGEIVSWSAADASVPVFEVAGSGPGGSFGSGAASHEAVLTHVFMSPGRYRWRDASGSKVGGTIEVRQVIANTKAEFDAWVKSVSSGTMVRIVGDKADRKEIEIPIGHTVCWTVEKAKGLVLQVEAIADEPEEGPRDRDRKAKPRARQTARR